MAGFDWGVLPPYLRRPGGQELTERLLQRGNLSGAAKVADVGCGSGGSVLHLRRQGFDAWGVEPDKRLRVNGQQDGNQWLLPGEGSRLPFAAGSLDAVLAECSLSAMNDSAAALTEFARALKPAGRVLVSDVYFRRSQGVDEFRRRAPGDDAAFVQCLSGARTREEWKDLFAANGYCLICWEDVSNYLGTWLAQMIMESDGECSWDGVAAQKLDAVRPGYFLLIAERAFTRRFV